MIDAFCVFLMKLKISFKPTITILFPLKINLAWTFAYYYNPSGSIIASSDHLYLSFLI